MSSWNPAQYLTFSEWRTRPSQDLALRVAVPAPRRIVDLGCGPGNSTAVCRERWPNASILGLDSSAEMIETARQAYPSQDWRVADIGKWVQQAPPNERFDVIFSSAALQWVPDHNNVFPRLIERLNPGGVLAVQMPAYEAIPNRIMRELAASESWRWWFPEGRANEWRSHTLEFYYAALARSLAYLDLWATDYFQVMPSLSAIVEWYKSTGLRPFLDNIPEADERERFLTEYKARLSPFYPESGAGGVPFLFRRIFVVAQASTIE
jgi:trans-aconitate 2-methyltransferase